MPTNSKHSKFLIKKTNDARDLELPCRQSMQSAGLDLRANVHDAIIIKSGARRLVPTGVEIALPCGYEAQIRPKSGLAIKHGITVLNAPGTIDADYRGEVSVILINHGHDDFQVRRGDRIAQMVIASVEMGTFEEVDYLPNSERGAGGFGSTGRD